MMSQRDKALLDAVFVNVRMLISGDGVMREPLWLWHLHTRIVIVEE